jgi:uncharacterized radical SAM superfamily Fe-S cluster-containing enzyme
MGKTIKEFVQEERDAYVEQHYSLLSQDEQDVLIGYAKYVTNNTYLIDGGELTGHSCIPINRITDVRDSEEYLRESAKDIFLRFKTKCYIPTKRTNSKSP